MAIRPIIKQGNPKLKEHNIEIASFGTEKLKSLVQDMIDTMRNADLIGLAAPQIAENFQVFITEPRETASRKGDQVDELRVFINPQLLELTGEEKIIYEGCGCVDNLFGPVSRKELVTIEAYDVDGNKFTMKADGILGRVMLHELDHLNGLEFTNHSPEESLVSRDDYIANIRNSEQQLKNSIISIKEYHRN